VHIGRRVRFLFAVITSNTNGTDGWRSYKSLENSGWQITQNNPNGGKNFDAMHRFIMTMKASLRGIYGSVRDLQIYLDEYVFKFNRLKMQGDILTSFY